MSKNRSHHAALRLIVDNSSSPDSDTPRRMQARKIGKCQEPGMRLRVRHLRTCQSVAPSDFAASAMSDQRSGENMSMSPYRDTVSPLSRPTVPLRETLALQRCGMAKVSKQARSIYRQAIRQRMKAARKKRDLTQKKVGELLQVGEETYKKWEQRGAIPADMVEPFAIMCHEDPCYILTGERREQPQSALLEYAKDHTV